MEEEKRTRLLQVGVDIDGGLERFMDNEALFLKCLRRFPTDTSFQQLEEALSAGDLQAAFVAAHTLKGVSGNLSLDAVFQASLPVVEALRCDNREEAEAAMPALRDIYQKTVIVLSDN
ncbi:MAG TPA: Hpt domain-containing protein [Candidatus Onthenecus intestinigallinarum]|uniref:Hpt domain-containing protein n=1 Tax=Candidatus Onthenecus intestinigallinarum TaxID=2840875 RepID=A0A9D0ZBC7_9FIRM|nr:Hpt domain-containing protein [Candidatus Onthenecus intestinigallinarum]